MEWVEIIWITFLHGNYQFYGEITLSHITQWCESTLCYPCRSQSTVMKMKMPESEEIFPRKWATIVKAVVSSPEHSTIFIKNMTTDLKFNQNIQKICCFLRLCCFLPIKDCVSVGKLTTNVCEGKLGNFSSIRFPKWRCNYMTIVVRDVRHDVVRKRKMQIVCWLVGIIKNVLKNNVEKSKEM